ncbi:hypothetical protein Pmar_PMAR029510 [Perkinsus marinus ATCC 50983]|uniref:Uncharacterized protein n=1 Tax=Perkinsus marinus (strain ATCC 50983 / TXsc) TaxID=423536 RepID=C5LD02_PERM5|nr:hypothetical protein Pmar_PMAR029510 [Perkinsus marinus ATCC 50983]EER05346.1 hypothetical protein Pmar_PMAR029510 [Perkinsus marinus ATCC 50983]|eukprot:XP_002773530.1 hypothetical protein Pmar_PMAR029510 [Perkinsus marinus ATCC 50983]
MGPSVYELVIIGPGYAQSICVHPQESLAKVKGVPTDDGPMPFMQIQYTEQFTLSSKLVDAIEHIQGNVAPLNLVTYKSYDGQFLG